MKNKYTFNLLLLVIFFGMTVQSSERKNGSRKNLHEYNKKPNKRNNKRIKADSTISKSSTIEENNINNSVLSKNNTSSDNKTEVPTFVSNNYVSSGYKIEEPYWRDHHEISNIMDSIAGDKEIATQRFESIKEETYSFRRYNDLQGNAKEEFEFFECYLMTIKPKLSSFERWTIIESALAKHNWEGFFISDHHEISNIMDSIASDTEIATQKFESYQEKIYSFRRYNDLQGNAKKKFELLERYLMTIKPEIPSFQRWTIIESAVAKHNWVGFFIGAENIDDCIERYWQAYREYNNRDTEYIVLKMTENVIVHTENHDQIKKEEAIFKKRFENFSRQKQKTFMLCSDRLKKINQELSNSQVYDILKNASNLITFHRGLAKDIAEGTKYLEKDSVN